MQMTPDAEILAMITSILVTILVVAGILSLVTYIFSSLGFYTLAKRRGILHPGLAWVPVCGARWIMGSLADQYVYFTEGKIKYQRRLLLLPHGSRGNRRCFRQFPRQDSGSGRACIVYG